MLTAKQHELLQFIQQRLDASGISPSFEEMKEALGLKSKSGIHRLISALEERGFLRRLPNRARALEVLKVPEAAKSQVRNDNVVPLRKPAPSLKPIAANDIIEVPLHGKIAAGVPIEAFEDHNQLAVPAALLGAGEHYALEVSGDSMVEAGIFDGDYALIQKVSTAREGDIVVALVDGQDATLKYFRREGKMIRLDPANSSYEPQRYEAGRVIVQGRLSGLLRRYH
ncbi:transcriptional repressor LexA [Sphingopyxis soli]|uniref:LexA repressor n=1 Tax=Sphingopyxis soli TaxID=592051 RepID=A0ABN1LYR9_9SPHN|nr:transcriptional repressor LexA [Sphingopyxis soli]